MVGDQQGRVGVSTTPWSPSPSWTFGDPIGTGTARAALNDVTCHGTHLCVAVDGSGYAVSTTAPSGPASGWKVTPISPGHSVAGVSCPAVSLCVAVADRSRVATTSHPAGSWHVDDLALSSADYEEGGQYPDTLGPISCASASLCVADRGTFSGPTVELLRNLSPSHFTASGKVLGAPKSEFVTAACPSAQLCLTVGDAGAEVDTSTDDAQHWKQHVVVPPHLQNGSLTPAPTAASCPSASFCALVDDRGYVLTSHHPTGGYREWNRVRLHGASEMYGVSCASTKLCVAIDKKGHVYTSTHPTRGTSAWKSSTLSPTLTAVACASNRLCVIATNDGHVVVGH
jgi:hypothetical protein